MHESHGPRNKNKEMFGNGNARQQKIYGVYQQDVQGKITENVYINYLVKL